LSYVSGAELTRARIASLSAGGSWLICSCVKRRTWRSIALDVSGYSHIPAVSRPYSAGLPSVTGQCYQWHQQTKPGVPVVVGAVAAGCHSTARAAVVAVGAVPWMRGATALVEGRKIEILVEDVGHHDTVNVRGVVEAVRCLGEGKERAERVPVRSSGWVWKQDGSNWLPQACA
jgi:hypothetical protein